MEWFRANGNYADSDRGYRVLFIKRGDGWLYLAYGPHIDYQQIKAAMKLRYEIGERVPVSREYIGSFCDPDAAKQACVEHWGMIDECGDVATR